METMTAKSVMKLFPATQDQLDAFESNLILDDCSDEILYMKKFIDNCFEKRDFVFDIKDYNVNTMSVDPILHKKYQDFKSEYGKITFTGNRIEMGELYSEILKRNCKIIGVHEKELETKS